MNSFDNKRPETCTETVQRTLNSPSQSRSMDPPLRDEVLVLVDSWLLDLLETNL